MKPTRHNIITGAVAAAVAATPFTGCKTGSVSRAGKADAKSGIARLTP